MLTGSRHESAVGEGDGLPISGSTDRAGDNGRVKAPSWGTVVRLRVTWMHRPRTHSQMVPVLPP